MKNYHLRLSGRITLIPAICLLMSCGKKDDVAPSQVLLNTDIESGASNPDYWFFDPGPSGAYTGTWTDEEASSKSHSLKVDATAMQTSAFSYWSQLYTSTRVGLKLPVGRDLTLSVKIKSKNLTGAGVSIAIRADNSVSPDKSGSTFSTTQGGIQINGTFDWKTYTVKMNNLRSD